MPVLWLSTDAVQLTAPIGDDGQLMSGGSGGWPVLWLSTNAVHFFLACGALFSVLLLHSSLSLFRLLRSYVVPLYRSSDFSLPMSFLVIALQTFEYVVPLYRFRLFRS